MPLPLSRPAFATCLLLALASALRAAEPPPEPVRPERTKEMNQAESSAAHSRWLAARNEWMANLTAQQYLEWRSRKSSRPRSPEEIERDQRFERGERLPLPTDGYIWQAAAAERKLDAAIIAALAKDKIAYGSSVKQSFEPYLGGPVFITSDSILNAFHVLFEDSFRELELRRAARFRPDFEKLLTSARQLAASGNVLTPEQAAPALQHLERVLGPALVITGTPLDFFATANRADIQAQVDRVNAATATELPAWLAPRRSRQPARHRLRALQAHRLLHRARPARRVLPRHALAATRPLPRQPRARVRRHGPPRLREPQVPFHPRHQPDEPRPRAER
jgi:hypothetical protein